MSAQLSLLNWAFTGALTRLASPLAPATVETPELLAGGEADALADGLALAEARRGGGRLGVRRGQV